MLSSESTIEVIEQNVMSSMIENEVVLLNIKRGLYFSLNSVGSYIWQLLDKPTSVTDIIAQVRSTYDAPEEEVEADVLALLRDFEQEGLIAVRAWADRTHQHSSVGNTQAPCCALDSNDGVGNGNLLEPLKKQAKEERKNADHPKMFNPSSPCCMVMTDWLFTRPGRLLQPFR
jgi:hypothetical protein